MDKDGERTLGLILAGGRARRMGGGDKGLVQIGGRSILERVVERMAPQLPRLMLNANGDPARFGQLGLETLPDLDDERNGPLAGILAGLDQPVLQSGAFGWLLSIPCDAPFLPRDLVARLHAKRRACASAGAVAASGGRRHPTIALWPAEGRETIRAALADGKRHVDTVVTQLGLAEADWPHWPADPFLNINDSGDLAVANRVLSQNWLS